MARSVKSSPHVSFLKVLRQFVAELSSNEHRLQFKLDCFQPNIAGLHQTSVPVLPVRNGLVKSSCQTILLDAFLDSYLESSLTRPLPKPLLTRLFLYLEPLPTSLLRMFLKRFCHRQP